MQRLFFHAEVCLKVMVGRVELFVAEPKGDHFQPHAGLEPVKGGAVSDLVRRDVALAQRRASGRRRRHRDLELMGDAEIGRASCRERV